MPVSAGSFPCVFGAQRETGTPPQRTAVPFPWGGITSAESFTKILGRGLVQAMNSFRIDLTDTVKGLSEPLVQYRYLCVLYTGVSGETAVDREGDTGDEACGFVVQQEQYSAGKFFFTVAESAHRCCRKDLACASCRCAVCVPQ